MCIVQSSLPWDLGGVGGRVDLMSEGFKGTRWTPTMEPSEMRGVSVCGLLLIQRETSCTQSSGLIRPVVVER